MVWLATLKLPGRQNKVMPRPASLVLVCRPGHVFSRCRAFSWHSFAFRRAAHLAAPCRRCWPFADGMGLFLHFLCCFAAIHGRSGGLPVCPNLLAPMPAMVYMQGLVACRRQASCWAGRHMRAAAGGQNMQLTRRTPSTRASTSSFVLYRANDARTVPSMPRRSIRGCAQW